MSKAIALLICLGFLGGLAVVAGTVLVCRLNPQGAQRQLVKWMAGWLVKGLVVPWLFWVLLNFGISWKLQPFMPQVQAAQNTGNWLSAWISTGAVGFYVLATYWTAATLIWALTRMARGLEGDMWADFKGLCLTCGLGLALPAAVVLILGGWANLGLAALVVLIPLAGYAPSILTPKKAPPMYARLRANRKVMRSNGNLSSPLRLATELAHPRPGFALFGQHSLCVRSLAGVESRPRSRAGED